MSYATLMVYVAAEEAPEDLVRVAADVAGRFNATLIGVSALGVRPPFVAEGVVIDDKLTEAEIKRLRAKLADKGNWFRATVNARRRKTEWRPVLDLPIEALAREARSADLIVIGRPTTTRDVYSSLEISGAILKVGRPTLVVPVGVRALKAEHIVVGWKDTREARRAVQDSLPFLHEANLVTIVEMCASGEEEAATQHIDDVARYLERHRIKAGPKIILRRQGPAAAQLIRLAQDEGADLIVTGAYGHSRLGEWIFGGMTRDLLATSPICCLMSH
jgi:nucleotide-binding universal stress UspA family protein